MFDGGTWSSRGHPSAHHQGLALAVHSVYFRLVYTGDITDLVVASQAALWWEVHIVPPVL